MESMSKEQAQLIAAAVKIEDLESQLKEAQRLKKYYGDLHEKYYQFYLRSNSLMVGYACLPPEKHRRKLDKKMELFFPDNWAFVKMTR